VGLVVLVKRARSPIVSAFAVQCVAWGLVIAGIALAGRAALTDRDLASAMRLDRLVWFSGGLDVGIAAVGLTLAVAGWRLGRRPAMLGAGAAIFVQGMALMTLHFGFAATLSRLI
jgi:hypothetical protein